jgi:predicted secreted protein
MNWVTGIAVYVCIWWVVIFAVLPWGIRTAEPTDEGHDAGAPENPLLLKKALVTTVIAAALWLLYYVIAMSDLITFREP